MKATTNKTATDFKPIDLTITIESKREFEFFHSLFGACDSDLIEVANRNRCNSCIFSVDEIETDNVYWSLHGIKQ